MQYWLYDDFWRSRWPRALPDNSLLLRYQKRFHAPMKLPVVLTAGTSNDSIKFESFKNPLLLDVDKARTLADIGPGVLRISFLSLGVKAQPHTWAQALFKDQTRFLPSTLLRRLADSLYFESADYRKITGKRLRRRGKVLDVRMPRRSPFRGQKMSGELHGTLVKTANVEFNLLKVCAAQNFYPFLFLLPSGEDLEQQQQQHQQQFQQQQEQQVALHLKQQQVEEAVHLVMSNPWVLLPHQRAQQAPQQQEQQQHQQQQHRCMHPVSLLCFEPE
ncbi:hypothetical protein Efla_007626 [Eimeria flavescens]